MPIQTLFRAGENGIAMYRIPVLLTLPRGRVLAFCEARRDSGHDDGCISVVLRVSVDGGGSFGPIRTIVSDGENTMGNPNAVFDRETGMVWLLGNGNPGKGAEKDILTNNAGVGRTIWATYSKDLGETWAPVMDLTASVKKPGWTWYAIGPCHGVQTMAGRLIFACNHAVYNEETGKSGPYIAHCIYSDDHGQTWKLGGQVDAYTNESTMAELGDGTLYMNMRSYHGRHCRAVSFSWDGGLTWTPSKAEPQLPEPVCQGSVLDFPLEEGKRGLLFSNPADPDKRLHMTLRISTDDGETWSSGTMLWEGPSAYSDIALLPNGLVGCMYECGEQNPYERIDLYMIPIYSI